MNWRTLGMALLTTHASFGLSSLPLRIEGHLPVVDDIWVNDKGPFRFALDTGAESSSVRPEIAAMLGIQPRYAVIVVTPAAELPVPALVASEVRAGQTRFTGVELLQSSIWISRIAGSRVDGILGQNFLGRAPVLLDLANARIWFDPNRSLAPKLRGERVKVDVVTGRLLVSARAGGKTLPLVIDSGASHVVLFETARLSGLKPATMFTNHGQTAVLTGRLLDLRLGKLCVRDVAAGLVESSARPERGLLPVSLFAAVYLDPVEGFAIFNPAMDDVP